MSATTTIDLPAPASAPALRTPTPAPPHPTPRVADRSFDRNLEAHLVVGVSASSQLPDVVEIVPWSDPTFEAAGHEVRSLYVERFWLATLGPSTVWLLRRLARGLDECPTGFRMNLVDTGRALGLGDSIARSSTTHRSVVRACQFGAAYRVSEQRLAVRTHLPSLTRRQVARLPETLQRAHERWLRGELDPVDLDRVEAVARALRSTGEPAGEVERLLRVYGYPNGVAREATRHAYGW